ncbi:hypothetical protein [Streptomyces sp. NPDC015125]|uniref:hypothetical protein n=1 Tax=Streptomyces sp. NPDC015125 TaxID=3364938 RepID=UPI0036FDDF9F
MATEQDKVPAFTLSNAPAALVDFSVGSVPAQLLGQALPAPALTAVQASRLDAASQQGTPPTDVGGSAAHEHSTSCSRIRNWIGSLSG